MINTFDYFIFDNFIITFQEYEETKTLLDEVVDRVKEIEQRKKQQQKQLTKAKNNPTTTHDTQHDVGPPPDNYRDLPIVPDVREILSEQPTYLRQNIVDGVYEDPQHYLDVSIV